MEAVHHYEGTVNKILGDGIMAIFGAPLAHEDHALRACYAALRMQKAVHAYSDELRRRQGVPVQIRVGLNSGEVVVGAVGSDFRVEYTAVGPNTHLAARMEQIAARHHAAHRGLAAPGRGPGRGQVAGPGPGQGLPEPIEVFELTGVGPTQSRLHAAASRGLAPFVGREEERRLIGATFAAAARGTGAAVALVGEAGVGKSRLARECVDALRRAGWLVLEASAVSYGRGTPFFPVIAILRAYFGVSPGDDRPRAREGHRESPVARPGPDHLHAGPVRAARRRRRRGLGSARPARAAPAHPRRPAPDLRAREPRRGPCSW